MAKGRRTSSYRRRKRGIRPNPFFIIVCEGEVTEPDYFKSFPYSCKLGYSYVHGTVHIVSGAGQHEKVVIKADEVWRKLKKEYGAISSNEVWCVFDCDGNTDSLNRAIKAAESKGFNAIYSIQCFELWFLLHFQPLTTAIDRKDYDRRLSNHLGINYEHGMKGMYHLLQNRQEDAIRAAKQLWEQKAELGELTGDPITNVFMLVEAL